MINLIFFYFQILRDDIFVVTAQDHIAQTGKILSPISFIITIKSAKKMKCSIEEKMETEFDISHLQIIEKSNAKNEMITQNLNGQLSDCSMPIVEQEVSIDQIDGDYLHEIQNCIEVDTSNLISIPENQIVKIQYENADGVINTEYIVNENILNTNETNLNGNFLNMQQNIYEEQVSYTLLNENQNFEISEEEGDLFENVDSINKIAHSKADINGSASMPSPQSEDDNISETDLTSLNWLHNITNIMAVPNLPTPPVSPKPKKKQQNSSQEDLTININYYKKNGEKKPPFSYATLICMAMGKNGNKMTLSAIYHWIRENFLYYRKAHPSWQVNLYAH